MSLMSVCTQYIPMMYFWITSKNNAPEAISIESMSVKGSQLYEKSKQV